MTAALGFMAHITNDLSFNLLIEAVCNKVAHNTLLQCAHVYSQFRSYDIYSYYNAMSNVSAIKRTIW